MKSVNQVLNLLNGRKTYLGAVLLSLLGAVSSLDLLLHDGTYGWLSGAQYASIGAIIGGVTGVALRIATGKAAESADLLKALLGLAVRDHVVETQQRFEQMGEAPKQ